MLIYDKRWTTVSTPGENSGDLIELEEREPVYNPKLEKYTDYRFSNSSKISTISKQVINEVKEDFNSIREVFSDIGDGVANGAKVFKYLPYLALFGAGYYIYKKAK